MNKVYTTGNGRLGTKPLGAIGIAALLFPIIIWGSSNTELKITFKEGILSLQNSQVERLFRYDTSSSLHAFYPTGWIDTQTGVNHLDGESRDWFEIAINGELIRSEEGGWDYRGFDERPLENGGKEVVIHLVGQASGSAVRGLVEIFYYCQFFPGSTWMRECLEIAPRSDQKIYLTKQGGEIRMSFPRYRFVLGNGKKMSIEEVRLAEWQGEVLADIDWRVRPDDRLQLSGGRSGRNLSQNHMYHPRRITWQISSGDRSLDMKGPILIALAEDIHKGLVMAYEHGSPDGDLSQEYLTFRLGKPNRSILNCEVRALNGAYCDGEEIPTGNPYRTVWTDIGLFTGDSFDHGEAAFWDFIYRNQSEHLAPRKPTFYYNTWGLQRDDQQDRQIHPQEVLTEERILEEIEYAAQLGIDIFVIDDGWQKRFGDWQPVAERLPNGFKRIKTRLDELGIRMGLWFAAEGIDPESELYQQHPEWLVRNAAGNEVIGRWSKPIVCFSSGYRDYFIALCKYWIDQGVTYFKWDGLDKHLCYDPNHRHGDAETDPEERAARSGYDFILAVTAAAEVITTYNPDVVIVYDVTEESRNLGLAFLSESRFFWINNGATWYGDFSYYRSKSIRSVAHLYNQIIPTVLQTSANYPHQSDLYAAQRYNVNTTLLGGGGFWGDLSEMSQEERERVGEVVRLFKQVAPTVVSTRPTIIGTVGSTPEIYNFIDLEKAEGSIIAFSGSAHREDYITQLIKKENFFCVLRNAFQLQADGSIRLPLVFPQPDATCEAFLISSAGFPGQIKSSSCWLRQAKITGDGTISFINGAPGEQEIFWPRELGKPRIQSDSETQVKVSIDRIKAGYRVHVEETEANLEITITSGK